MNCSTSNVTRLSGFFFQLFMVGGFWLSFQAFSIGQSAKFTLTNTPEDTTIARQLWNESNAMVNEGKAGEAIENLYLCQAVFSKYQGSESLVYADITYDIGFALYRQQINQLAKEKIDTSLMLYQRILGNKDEKTANAFNFLGVLFKTFNVDSAIVLILKSLEIKKEIFGEVHESIADSWLNLGGCYQDKGEAEKALECYDKCLEVKRQIFGDDYKGDHNVFNNMGLIYNAQQNYNAAQTYYFKALEIRKKENLLYELPLSYLNLCYMFGEAELPDSAVIYGNKGLSLCKDLGEEKGISAAQIHHALGHAYFRLKNFRESQFHFESSLKLLKQNLGDTHPFLTTVLSSLSFCTTSGPSHALEYLFSGLDICQKSGGYCPDIYGNIAENYSHQKDWNKAIEFGWKSMVEFQKQNENQQFSIGVVWNNLGNYYTENGDFEKGLECYDSSIQTFFKIYGGENPWNSYVLSNKAGNYLRQSKMDSAEYCHQKAFDFYFQTKANDTRYLLQIYENWSEQKSKEGNIESAISLIDSAISVTLSRVGGFNEGLAEGNIRANTSKGSLCLKKFKENKGEVFLNQAQMAFAQAEESLWESVNSSVREDDKARLLQSLTNISEGLLISNSLQEGKVDEQARLEEAFQISEKSKAAILRNALNTSNARHFFGVPDSVLNLEYNLKTRFAYLDSKKHQLESTGVAPENTELLDIQNQLFAINRQLDSFELEFGRKYEAYHRLKYELTTIPLEEVQNSLLAPDQTLLEYFVGDSSIFIFVVKKGEEPHLVEVKKDFPLEEWVGQFHRSLDTTIYTGQYIEYAQELYRELVFPVAQWLPDSGRVVVIPDGVLGYVSFGALMDGPPKDGQSFATYPFLAKKYQFSYCYSATLLREMQQKQHRKDPDKAFAAFVAVGKGNGTAFSDRFSYDPSMPRYFEPLPYSNDTMESTMNMLGGGDIYEGEMSTWEVFEAQAGNYGILQLYMHGWADGRAGDYSFLVFNPQAGSEGDGLVYARDLYNVELNADLVVLSACETNRGRLRRGEGIISLAKAFSYAGAKSLVTTLWRVNATATTDITSSFYSNLKSGMTKDVALWKAQKDYLENKETTNERLHPHYWAGLVLVGDVARLGK